jgi:DNA-binding NtrC family response regulator
MRAGAFDYLLKPLPSNDVLRLAVERAAERRRLIEENRRLREPLAPRTGFDDVVGKSPAIAAVFELVRRAARSEANVLIQGESGTGKELVARATHAQIFYRVNVITITLPPLRERTGDVTLLAHHFLRRYGRNRERPLEGIEPEALSRLDAYAWPGNVRELQNVIERACALTDGPIIRIRDLPDHVRGRGRPAPLLPAKDLPLAQAREAWLQTFAQEYLTDLLGRHHGNISQAAKTAGIDRKTLHRLLPKHQIRI